MEDIENINTRIMLDFPMYIRMKNQTQSSVIGFLTPIQADPNKRISILKDPRLVNNKDKVIPVVTYNPNSPFVQGYLSNQEKQLRAYYDQLAFRIYPLHFDDAINELPNIVRNGDIVLLDIDENSPTHSTYQRMYKIISNLCNSIGIDCVLIRSAIPSTIKNVDLQNGQIIFEADNSLLTQYKKLGFTAFGDYCGVKKDDLTTGGVISPGYIFYSWKDNSYYGFKGVLKQATTFESILVPAVLNSNVWSQYLNAHKTNCLGCSSIEKISLKQKKGNAQPEWKGFACGHYLYTMEEFL